MNSVIMEELARREERGERYMRVRDVARLLNVAEMTVYRWVWSGRLDAVRMSGGRILRIPVSAVEALLRTDGRAE